MDKLFLLSLILLIGCVQQQPATPITPPPPAPSVINCAGGGISDFNGSHEYNGSVFADSCISNDTAQKYYCDNNVLMENTTECGTGYGCLDGGCVPSASPQNVTHITPNCLEFNASESTGGYVELNGTEYHDSCQGLYSISYYSCVNDVLDQATAQCPLGDQCSNGACRELNRTCTESPAQNASIPGTVTLYGGGIVIDKKQDYCASQGQRVIYSCSGGSIANTTVKCASDSYCNGGACVPLCQESENGLVENGTVFSNFCIDNNTLQKFTCSGDSINESIESCDNYCDSGQCLPPSDLSCVRTQSGADIQYQNKVMQTFSNSCLDYQTGRTYACDGANAVASYQDCQSGQVCQAGQCIPITQPSCFAVSQGNSGDVHYNSSIVLTNNQSITSTEDNRCFTDTILVQYYCDGSNYDANFTTCPDDERCHDGICYNPFSCEVTSQRSAGVPGAVTIYDGGAQLRTEQDLCSSEGGVRQVSCSNSTIVYNIVPCPNGMNCDSENGTCR